MMPALLPNSLKISRVPHSSEAWVGFFVQHQNTAAYRATQVFRLDGSPIKVSPKAFLWSDR